MKGSRRTTQPGCRAVAASLYGILGVPHAVLIDPDGRIRISGSLDAAAGALEKLLQEP
jgi:hypothetical protein